MSTVHEVIAARHVGAEVLGLSLVTNLAAGLGDDAPRPRRRARRRAGGGRVPWATSSRRSSPACDRAGRTRRRPPRPGARPGGTRTPTRAPRPRSTPCSRPTTSTGCAERFDHRLQFGTAGLRGALGAGPNRMNRALVRRATAGRGGLAARSRASTGRWWWAATPATAAPTSPHDTAAVLAGAGFPVRVLPRPAAHAGHRLRHPPRAAPSPGS